MVNTPIEIKDKEELVKIEVKSTIQRVLRLRGTG
jgi:hypothetical protein